jgi:hypothetical protein
MAWSHPADVSFRSCGIRTSFTQWKMKTPPSFILLMWCTRQLCPCALQTHGNTRTFDVAPELTFAHLRYFNLLTSVFSATLFGSERRFSTASNPPTFVRAPQKKREPHPRGPFAATVTAVTVFAYFACVKARVTAKNLTFSRYTETDHPQRRTTFKDLVSVGRRMMYAARRASRMLVLCVCVCVFGCNA